MTPERTFERLQEANPVPGPMLDDIVWNRAVLLAEITERTREMLTHDETHVERPSRDRRTWLAAASVALVVVVAAAFLALRPTEETAVTTVPDGGSPLDVATTWVDAMNRGDLATALAVLSPDAVCDLPAPTGEVETCEQHLGYLVAIGTHFEMTRCRESAPYRCSYDLTSDLHATLGYPNYALPMITVFTLDDEGLLLADFFGSVDPTTAYYPGEAGELWEWLASRNPGMDVDRVFGPKVLDESAGEAVMAAAESFTDPERIVEFLQGRLDVHNAAGMLQCGTPDGSRACSELVGFLDAIGATVQLECDVAATESFRIPCEAIVDSDVHQMLGSGASTSELVIEYRGGMPRGFELDVRFSEDPTTHEAFMEFARQRVDLYGPRPIWTRESGPAWIASAEEFTTTQE